MKRVWIAVLAVLTGVVAVAILAPVSVLNFAARDRAVTIESDIPFGADARLRLDIYKPADARGPSPVVVFFYGGSWQRGDRALYRFVGSALARAGIVAVIPDYRLYPPVLYPDFLRDSALAVRWTKDNIARFGGNPARLFLSGHSAGAYNAVSLATDRRWLAEVRLDPKADLAGVIGIAGPYDFLPLEDEYLKIIFGPEESRPKTQPINYVDGDEPPLLLLRPKADSVVDPGNSTRLAKRVEAKGGSARVITYERVGHLSIVGTLSPLLSFLAPVKDDLVQFVRDPQSAKAGSQ